ncbi:S24 family peptidase [Bacteroides reticulotermitis]|uniref:S24 family peptidase n=1 Tax=Bacteroides reticulotermitis TaxID=1133319 RepID=UPI003A88E98E
MDDITNRFISVYKEMGLTGYKMGKISTVITKQKISAIEKHERNVSIDIISEFCSLYPSVNADYIVTGNGEMLKSPLVQTIGSPKSKDKIIDNQSINLYDIEAAANLTHLLANKDQNILGKISIPNIPRCDGAVYIKGDSMYPLLKSGDIVAYKEITLDVQHIIYGEMYLVSIDMDGDEYLAVKYVNQSDQGEDWIKLVSYNQYHQPKEFPLSSVKAMALIKFSIRLNTMA